MPRIQEYLPQEGAAQPQGGVSPNLEVVGQLGEGVKAFGRGVTEVADVVENRSAQLEAADAQSQAAEAKANFYDRISNETSNGKLDQNALFKDYDEWVDKTSGNYTTTRGRAEFERASGRMRGSIIRWAAQGNAKIAEANALSDHANTVNSLTSLTSKDPHSFADNIGQLDELYKGYQEDPYMNKNPAALEKMKLGDQAQLATSAIQGQMDSDFNSVVQDMVANDGKVDPTNPKYNVAGGMLATGFYDKYLGADKQEQLKKSIRANFTAAQTEGKRIIDVQDAAKETQIQDWQSSVTPKLATGQLSTKEILAGAQQTGMTMEATLSMIKSNAQMAKLAMDKNYTTPPQVFADVNRKILDGKITTPEELMKYTSVGLSGDDYKTLHSLIPTTPAGKVSLSNEKAIMAVAKSRLVSENLFLGKNDPEGLQQLNIFSNALQKAKQEAVAKGEPVSAILDATSPKYFGSIKNIDTYRLTQEQQMAAMKSKFNIPQPAPSATASKNPPPGLTLEQFKEWKKKNAQ